MIEFDEFAKLLASAVPRVKADLARDAEIIGEAQVKIAKEMIGHENDGWAPLAASTIADKKRKGYAVPAPLLRDGTMRESIESKVEANATGVEIDVGSDSKIALYQEIGTPTIPPRPFLATSAVKVIPLAEKTLGETAVAVLTPPTGVR